VSALVLSHVCLLSNKYKKQTVNTMLSRNDNTKALTVTVKLTRNYCDVLVKEYK